MENNVIGTQISLLRKKFGLTQEDLANKLGFSKQTISNWETGLKTPRMGAIQKIADLFNVSKSFIIEGVEEAPS
ncbi:helix-turn-helix transcriptional regulator, partial [Enterococcus hirae]|nr:helix-turn-helix transcriptional regulator [Enterococcus hirae]